MVKVLIRDRHDRSLVLHCRSWRWANDAAAHGKHRCGFRRATCRAAHPFYERLNRLFDDAGFDAFVEAQCARFYADGVGRPSLAPGRYFRLLVLGYFEGLDSERAIAWRAADSLSVRSFLHLELPDPAPDHSTISRTRRLIDLETHTAVFTWMLQRLADAGLVTGQTIGIDATTLEANAALRSIVRRDTGESYDAFLTRLAQASGIATPTRADLARVDRTRKKKGSNDDWTHPHDPDAKITKMKDGRTHLAHKAEHAIDLDTGAVVSVTVQPADDGDTQTLAATVITAAEQIETVQPVADAVRELVGDKRYHSNQVLVDLEATGVRAYLSEPDRGRRNWRGKAAARDAVYRNLRRIRGARGPTAVAPTRRAPGTSLCPSLRDGRDAPRTSAGSHQHPEARARAHRRLQPGAADASADRRRDASEPARPCGDPARRAHRPPAQSLGTSARPLGLRSTGFVARRTDDMVLRARNH